MTAKLEFARILDGKTTNKDRRIQYAGTYIDLLLFLREECKAYSGGKVRAAIRARDLEANTVTVRVTVTKARGIYNRDVTFYLSF